MVLRHADLQAHVRGRQHALIRDHLSLVRGTAYLYNQRALRTVQPAHGIVVRHAVVQYTPGPCQRKVCTRHACQLTFVVIHLLRMCEHRIGMVAIVVRQTPVTLIATLQRTCVPVAVGVIHVVADIIHYDGIFVHAERTRHEPATRLR